MKCFPIIPVWLMIIICIGLFIYLIKNHNKDLWCDILIVILMFLVNLRIMYPSDNSEVYYNNLDVLFVIDNTISMNALDYNNTTRLSGVKADCEYIIDKLNGSKFSVITFNNYSQIVTPFTQDTGITISAINAIEPISTVYAKGTSLNVPIDDILYSLDSSKEDRQKIIFFISDGEITDDSSLTSYSEIKSYDVIGAVLGYGTTSGGYMKDTYYNSSDYIKYFDGYSYDYAVSKIDEDNLKQIASDMGIDYINMSKQSNIDDKIAEILKMTKSNLSSSDKSGYDDTYYYFIVLILVLLIYKYYTRRKSNV